MWIVRFKKLNRKIKIIKIKFNGNFLFFNAFWEINSSVIIKIYFNNLAMCFNLYTDCMRISKI